MTTCPVCHSEENHHELVDEVFQVDGQYVLIGGVPAIVCSRCGEQAFSRKTVERARLIAHSETKPAEMVSMRVFEFAS